MLSALLCSAVLGAPPNVVFILIDDLGWPDIGCYGNEFVDTPHIDRLAADGMRFTSFYAAGPVCSPTRASIQSGQHQARFGLTDFIAGHWRPFERLAVPQTRLSLPLDTMTVAECLREAGYTTGYFGKWHLSWGGTSEPEQQGYDVSMVTGGRHFAPNFRVQNADAPRPRDGEYLADYLTDRTCEFIEANRDRPFFAFLSHYAVHIPLEAKDELIEKYRHRDRPPDSVCHPVYAAMIEHCDQSVGRIAAKLEELGLGKNTLVVFTSDNGGLRQRYDGGGDVVTSNAPLRGEKGTLYEGGIRVPFVAKWPGRIPAGTTCDVPTISHDFYPTLVELAGGPLPVDQRIDGKSLSPILTGIDESLDRDAIYFHYPHYHHSRPAGAIRVGNWKLIEFFDDGSLELYNLADDLGESKNMADNMPEKTRELSRRLKKWRQEIGAAMPMENPAYDSNRHEEWWNKRSLEPINRRQLQSQYDTPRVER